MTTRAKVGIFKPHYHLDLAHLNSHVLYRRFFSADIPLSYTTTLHDPKWRETMCSEMAALHHNQTWTLVPRPSHANIVGCRWLFRTKYRADGTVENHKACLVTQGFSQVTSLEEPIEIIDRKVKRLKHSNIPIVKVR